MFWYKIAPFLDAVGPPGNDNVPSHAHVSIASTLDIKSSICACCASFSASSELNTGDKLTGKEFPVIYRK